MVTRIRVCLVALAACGTPLADAFAQGVCLTADPSAPVPVNRSRFDQAIDEEIEILFGQADRASAETAEFSGDVSLRYGNQTFTAESAFFNRTESSFDFEGRVTYSDSDVSIFSEDAFFDSASRAAIFGESGFEIPAHSARGSASAIELNDIESSVSLRDVQFTTCPMEAEAWRLMANDVEFNVEEGIGTARGMKLRFRGVPLLYAPYFTFPLNDERKSGFLVPSFSERDRTGFYLAAPYYFNLAPNYDLVLEPRYMSKRGVQISNEFRYLLDRSDGQLNFEYLPDDSDANRERSYVNLQHSTEFGDNWALTAAIQEVSDAAYFEDLGSSLSVTSQTHLNRFINLGYFGQNWSVLTRLQNYQTIDPFIDVADQPYERVPQMLFDGSWGRNLVRFDSASEIVNFERNVGITGWRFDSTQEVSFNLNRAGMYLTPAVAWRQTNYWVDDPNLPQPSPEQNYSRGLPVSSLDAGLIFERTSTGKNQLIQTLEPRLLYVNVPFEDQSMLPVFDTILPDFNLIQLFRKYQFVGADRVSDTDQLSVGVTTRLINGATGRERLIATLGQTRYLSPQRVSLPDDTPNVSRESNYVAEVSVNLDRSWNFDVGYQWNDRTNKTARAETRFEYRPGDDRLFGFGYRFRRNSLEQGDVSIVWPVSERWRLIGRYSYSLLEKEPLEQFVGWEYDACCWRLRVIGRQYVSRRTGQTDSAISIQLELKGLSNDSSSPEDLLDRGILGYRRMTGNRQL